MAKEPSSFSLLSARLNKLLEILSALEQENQGLRTELEQYRGSNFSQRISGLESEIHNLRRENKLLKEREKLIKNKMERLAVKLEKIEL